MPSLAKQGRRCVFNHWRAPGLLQVNKSGRKNSSGPSDEKGLIAIEAGQLAPPAAAATTTAAAATANTTAAEGAAATAGWPGEAAGGPAGPAAG